MVSSPSQSVFGVLLTASQTRHGFSFFKEGEPCTHLTVISNFYEFKSEFLHLSIIALWGWVVLWGGGHPMWLNV